MKTAVTTESAFEFLQFNPDGSPAGVLKVWSKIRLNADGKTLPLRNSRGAKGILKNV
jgi:hypothetical protein